MKNKCELSRDLYTCCCKSAASKPGVVILCQQHLSVALKEETLISVLVGFFKFTCSCECQVLSWKPSQYEQETAHVQVSM